MKSACTERLTARGRTPSCAGAIGTSGAQWQSWTAERTTYLGLVLQKMLRGYTEAAVSITSSLVTVVSRFALQVGGLGSDCWSPLIRAENPLQACTWPILLITSRLALNQS